LYDGYFVARECLIGDVGIGGMVWEDMVWAWAENAPAKTIAKKRHRMTESDFFMFELGKAIK